MQRPGAVTLRVAVLSRKRSLRLRVQVSRAHSIARSVKITGIYVDPILKVLNLCWLYKRTELSSSYVDGSIGVTPVAM